MKFAKVMFLQVSVCPQRGGMHGGGHAWQGVCMVWGMLCRGHAWPGRHVWLVTCFAGDMCEMGTCMGGCAWLRACLAGASMVGGMCGQGWPVWLGACVAGEMTTAVGVRILLECIFKL